MAGETRTITIFRADGRIMRMRIPVEAKVTFGPLAPGRGDGYSRPDQTGGLYLRVYRTQNQQLAVIPGVTSFIDDDCSLEELLYEKGNISWQPVDDKWLNEEKAKKQTKRLMGDVQELNWDPKTYTSMASVPMPAKRRP